MLDIKHELSECREYAQNGFEMAQDSYSKMKEALREERNKLREADRKQNKIKRIENDKHFRNQLKEMDALEKAMLNDVERNLDDLKARMDDFTIVLYGRTMAGKSTLMEILTHGNGSSIGKGAQRTTLDVRPYTWNGLKIFDVPGTCSFGGSEDDAQAYEAAKSADLALFLLTDDAPQPSEAERLAELKKLGKPVLGIVNVKQVLSEPTNTKRKIEIKSLTKKINDKKRLDEIIHQFKEFGQKYGYNFDDIPFVTSHLKAAFLSQEERENDSELYRLSNFGAVEEFVLEKVKNDGKFIRIKTFADSVALPMQNTIDQLYKHCAESHNLFWVYDEKLHQLDKWRASFIDSMQNRYDNFIDGIQSQLNAKLDSCVNHYYDDSNAGEKWKEAIESLRIGQQCQSFIERMGNESTRKLREFSDELTQDLRYTSNFNVTTNVYGSDTTDYGSIARTLSTLLIFTPVGWAAIVGTFLSTFLIFDSKEKKIREAKKKLREALEPSRDEILANVSDGVIKILNDEILHKQIDGFIQNLLKMRDMIARLSYVQNALAATVNEKYRDINIELFIIAMEYANLGQNVRKIMAMRSVGSRLIAFSTGKMEPHEQRKMSDLLGEEVSVFTVSEDCYWKDVFEIVRNSIIESDFEGNQFLNDEYWGYDEDSDRMYVIQVQANKSYSDEQIRLLQQITDGPVINIRKE